MSKGGGFFVGMATFALTEIGTGLAVFRWGGGGTNDMIALPVIVVCLFASPLCSIASVVAGSYYNSSRIED